MFVKEPLFKALTQLSKKWVHGGAYRQEDGRLVIITPKDKHYFVKPETLCIATGFTDENGDNIFTGDYIENKKYQAAHMLAAGLVKMYEDGAFHIEHRCRMGNGNHVRGLNKDIATKCVIIGNFFDDTKQLEVNNGQD